LLIYPSCCCWLLLWLLTPVFLQQNVGAVCLLLLLVGSPALVATASICHSHVLPSVQAKRVVSFRLVSLYRSAAVSNDFSMYGLQHKWSTWSFVCDCFSNHKLQGCLAGSCATHNIKENTLMGWWMHAADDALYRLVDLHRPLGFEQQVDEVLAQKKGS